MREITIKLNTKTISVIIGIIISVPLLALIICEGILFSYYAGVFGYYLEYEMGFIGLMFAEAYRYLFSLLLEIFVFIGLWLWIIYFKEETL